MSHQNKETLIYQVTESLNDHLKIGESKHLAKQDGSYKEWIYSYSTFQSYLKAIIRFVKYSKAEYGCKILEECRPYANEWLETRLNLSAWTVAMERSALVKLYQCPYTEFIKLPPRTRDSTKRSRGAAKRDAHFSEENNRDLIDFCVSCGPRRAELKALTGDKLVDKDGNPYVTGDPYILFNKGTKGGRNRISPVMGNSEKVIALMRKAGSGKVFSRFTVPPIFIIIERSMQQKFTSSMPETLKSVKTSVSIIRNTPMAKASPKAALTETAYTVFAKESWQVNGWARRLCLQHLRLWVITVFLFSHQITPTCCLMEQIKKRKAP